MLAAQPFLLPLSWLPCLFSLSLVFLVTLRSLFHSIHRTGSNSDLWWMIVLLTLCVPASNFNASPGTYYVVIITIGKTKGTVCPHARYSSCFFMPVGGTAPLLDKLYTSNKGILPLNKDKTILYISAVRCHVLAHPCYPWLVLIIFLTVQ